MYRLLEIDEIIKAGDEAFTGAGWKLVDKQNYGAQYKAVDLFPVRREVVACVTDKQVLDSIDKIVENGYAEEERNYQTWLDENEPKSPSMHIFYHYHKVRNWLEEKV